MIPNKKREYFVSYLFYFGKGLSKKLKLEYNSRENAEASN